MQEYFEESYYERDEFWNPSETRKGDHEKVYAVLSLVPDGVKSLLDVGCGGGLLANRAKRKIQNTFALDRSKSALKYVMVPRVRGDSSYLPFGDCSFDMVTCLEVLEHLPFEKYKTTLKELTRVSKKYIIVSVPYKEKLKSKRVECPKCLSIFHMYYHLRAFNREKLISLFEDSFSLQLIEQIGTREAYGFGIENLKEAFWYANKIKFPLFAQCPLCGWKEQPSSSLHSGAAGLKTIIKKYWPKTKRPRWYLAIYHKKSFLYNESFIKERS